MTFHVDEECRVTDGCIPLFNSTAEDGTNGMFVWHRQGLEYRTIVSAGMGWEHVSVQVAVPGRRAKRVPTWEQLCLVKSLFWDSEDAVVQFHPPESDYVNDHDFVLHLWRPIDEPLPLPPSIMV